MNDYYSVRIDITPCTADASDLVAAFLADAGFESFEPDSEGLTAYIPARYSEPEKIADEALADFPLECNFRIKSEFIEGQDWNEEWEKNYFRPIIIGDRCVVHSSFHNNVPKAEYDIVIDPKMAFGTGHHDTTSQMMKYILDLPLQGKRVIDVGTGTGILGILAAMRGATEVTGIEIDEGACLNALENVALNNVKMMLIHGDASALDGLEKADFLFANINRNIITSDIDRYAVALKKGGEMLLSGFYEEDIPVICDAAGRCGLKIIGSLVSNRWTALRLSTV